MRGVGCRWVGIRDNELQRSDLDSGRGVFGTDRLWGWVLGLGGGSCCSEMGRERDIVGTG